MGQPRRKKHEPVVSPLVGAFTATFLVGAAWLWESPVRTEASPAAPPAVVETAPAAPAVPPAAWSHFVPAWEPVSPDGAGGAVRELAGKTTATLRALVEDPEGRLGMEFRVPPSLRARVLFWMHVYSLYGSRARVIHDRDNLDIVYGHIDLSPVYRLLGDSREAREQARRIEKEVLSELSRRLSDAAEPPTLWRPATPESAPLRRFVGQFDASGELASNLRTQTGQLDEFLRALERSRPLLPRMETLFRDGDLPVLLTRLPFVESSFNVTARSKVGAMGIWQFMPKTAAQMIHRTDRRRWAHPIHQSRGAVKLLKMYRRLLPDWGTTLTSYNSGVGRVRKILDQHDLRGIEDLVNRAPRSVLGFAGRNFYSQFLAASLVEAYRDKLFVASEETPLPRTLSLGP